MTPTDPPWLQVWQDAQREIARLAAAASTTSSSPMPFAQQRLSDFATDYAGVAAAAFAQWQAGGASLDAFSAALVERYQRLFTPPGFAPANPEAAQGTAAWLRVQQAHARYAQLALAIATDAGRRLVATLSASGPAAPPVTTLRELHALWIECGEAAWAAAAHRDEFAEAQAELLAAHVEFAASAKP